MGEERKPSTYAARATANGSRQQYSYQPAIDLNQKITGKYDSDSEQNSFLNRKCVHGSIIRTRTTESDHEEVDMLDKNSGFILVDLKGDKVVHIDQDYLIGCEVRSWYSF